MLADVAKAKGVERLEPGYAITIADVEAALAREKVRIGAGDVVLVHTGWGALSGNDNAGSSPASRVLGSSWSAG